MVLASILERLFLAIIYNIKSGNEFKHRLELKFKEIKDILKFGIFQTGDKLVNFFLHNIDYILIGKFLGMEILGYYTIAYILVTIPITRINPILTSVMFPAFSRISDDNIKIRENYYTMIESIAFFVFPLLFGLFAVFIIAVYGSKWIPVTPILQVLCFVGVLRTLINPIGTVYLSKGRSDLGLVFQIIVFIGMFASIMIGLQFGIMGVSFAVLINTLCIMLPFDFIIRKVLIKTTIKEYLKRIYPTLLISIVMGASVLGLNYLLNLPAWVELAISVPTGAVVYIILSLIFSRKSFLMIYRILLNK